MLIPMPPAQVSMATIPPTLSDTTAPTVTIAGDWQIRVSGPGFRDTTLQVAPPTVVQIKDERIDKLRAYDDKAAPWGSGVRLQGVITYETTAPDALIPDSVRLKAGQGEASQVLRLGTDYRLEPRWGTVGSLPGGSLASDTPVWADYSVGRGRVDSVVLDAKKHVVLREGVPDVATPHPPDLAKGERRLCNIWVKARLEKLTNDFVFPVVETRVPPIPGPPVAEKSLPKTWAKLTGKTGGKLHILAWGDSVTAGGQASDPAHQYQSQFLARLRQRFPSADIALTTVAWGGRNTASFLAEPPGSQYNFQEKVLDPHPDLVVMEFVNDAGLNAAQIEERYSGLLARFKAIGTEWVILTPHFVWGEWMRTGTKKVEHDPRPYVAGLHQFVERHSGEGGLALADASRHWEHLAKEGIPFQTLLCNSLNHPDDRGHALFADALMELFGTP